ncbi:Leucine rich repeat protein, partial [Spraguea lophii 42_110]
KNISEININLVYLKCSNNKIDSFYITENNIIYLIMDKNEMREFHLNFNFYKKIKALDLNKNKITKFTVKHPDKSKLVKLNLSDNEIERIEENIKYLNLELLDLRNNKLNSESANIIISMKNLKYLDLKGNNIEYLRTIESKILLFLNISKNPIVLLHKDFFDMPCIRRVFMSDLDISASPSLRRSMNNLSVLDISYTKINTFPYVHNSLVSLEFLNLSNCKLKKFPEGINTEKLKKLNLSNNDLKNLPAKFRELKDKQIILDLRNNPLDSFSDRRKLGALDLLEIFYSKILLDNKIYEKIRNIPFKLIYSQRPHFKIFKFEKSNKVIMKNEYCLHYLYPLLDSDDQDKVITILTFAEKIRTSGFLLFEFLFEKVGKMIKNSEDINNVVNKIYLYLTERYSSKIYKFLKETVDEYKKLILKKSIIKIYGSEQNYNYWVFKFKEILMYNQENIYFNEDDGLFYDINIILNSFINNINLEEFIEIIKNKIKGDIPIFRAYSLMVKFIRRSGFYKKHKKHGEININNISNDDIRALLRIFQFLY